MINPREKLAYRKNIDSCVLELTKLSKTQPTELTLLSLEETKKIKEEAGKQSWKFSSKFTVDFEEKKSERFISFLDQLFQSNPSPVYIWTELTDICGFFEMASISNLNLAFDFYVNKEGLILFLTKDMREKMTFDFFIDSSGEKKLELDVAGTSWPLIKY